MQIILVLSALLAAATSAPPAAPSGRLILLPARQQHPPPAEAATPTTSPATPTTTPTTRRDSDAEPETPQDVQSEKLQDSGEYYVLTPEGKLQMVKYTTAALKTAQPAEPRPQPFAQFQPETPQDVQSEKLQDAGEYYVLTPEGKLQMVKYTTAALKTAQPAEPRPQPFAQFQIEYFQYPGFEVQAPAQVKAEEEAEEDAEEESGYEAKLQFRNVKPITAPVYTYNPAPAVRILKK